ncbi:MAG: TIM barrel protein, partial [Puniceicoccales bacterium]|nr:TIM barrel protein [Puniceicoccales bacterium]
MNRRQALKTAAFTGALAAFSRLVPSVSAQDAAPVPAGSSFRHSVSAGFGGLKLDKLAVEAKKLGIEGIDLVGVNSVPVLTKAGVVCSLAWGASKLEKGYNRRELHDKYVEGEIAILEKCGQLGVPSVICFSGNRGKESDEQSLEICAEGLKKVVGAAEKAKVTLVMELLNSKVNHKGYQCDHTAWGVELVKRVGSERFKLLYDIYHMQIMEGDIIRTIRKNAQYIGHYHTAGNPGRNEFEPGDVQELNYPGIMKAIHDTGYRGFVGQEFSAKRKPALASLAAA